MYRQVVLSPLTNWSIPWLSHCTTQPLLQHQSFTLPKSPSQSCTSHLSCPSVNTFSRSKIPQAGPPCWESGLSCPTLQAGVDPTEAAQAAVATVTEAVCARDGLPSTDTVGLVDSVFTLVQLALDDRCKERTKQTDVSPGESAFRSALLPVRILPSWVVRVFWHIVVPCFALNAVCRVLNVDNSTSSGLRQLLDSMFWPLVRTTSFQATSKLIQLGQGLDKKWGICVVEFQQTGYCWFSVRRTYCVVVPIEQKCLEWLIRESKGQLYDCGMKVSANWAPQILILYCHHVPKYHPPDIIS